MKKLSITLAICGALIGGTVMTTTPSFARDSFAFSFDAGGVTMGFSNGYYDRDHRWHAWRSAREAREFRRLYGDRYRHARWDHRRRAWGDWDRDGVPNRFDDAPRNPYRN